LGAAVHSSFVAGIYPDQAAWQDAVAHSSVRLQWDPDHDPRGAKVERRAIQLGLRDDALMQYTRDWLIEIEDISGFVSEQRGYAQTTTSFAQLRIPREDIYPVHDVQVARHLGVSDYRSAQAL
jgi:hypothetical protein